MKLSEKVQSYLNDSNRINILSTSNKKGETDIAVFGTPKLTEDFNLSMVLQDSSRSYAYLKENPYASCLVLIPGEGKTLKGCRVYLKVSRMDLTRNPVFLKERDEEKGGWEKSFNVELNEETAKREHPDRHLIIFQILDARPIVDRDQGI